MGAFSSIDVAQTGVSFSHVWLETVAHNVANLNTVRPGIAEPFRARLLVAQERTGGTGVALANVLEDGREAARVYDPANPIADADGNVTLPVVDLGGQMTDMLVANRTYQANLKVIESGREAYAAALRIGQQ
jgi:flagellar basal-body rod protein FlgC